MGDENIISKDWNSQLTIFLVNLTICRKRSTKKSVHDIRVAIKKMRSYLRLKKRLNDDNWKEQFQPTADMFKAFGQLRDFEMALALTRKYERKEGLVLLNFRKFLAAGRSQARRSTKQIALSYNEQQLEIFQPQFLSLNKFSPNEIFERIIHFAKKKIEKVDQLAKEFHKNVHKIRKLLKDVYYWLMVCPSEIAENAISLKGLDKVLNSLGKWQDHFILKNKIRLYSKQAHSLEKEILKSFEKILTRSQTELLHKARHKWEHVNRKSDK